MFFEIGVEHLKVDVSSGRSLYCAFFGQDVPESVI